MRFWIATVALTSVICIAATPIPAQAQNAASGVPRLMQVPGQVLTPAGDARTGNVLLTFAIYQDQTGGTPLWTEQQVVTLGAGGRYSVLLGSATAEGLSGRPVFIAVQLAA